MNELEIFKNEEFGEIRTIVKDKEPMFCLADVCRVLEIKNVSDCKTRLSKKGVVTTDTLTNGGNQKLIFINESNLYKVIFQSRKPEAEKFSDWVTSEVLPSIRQNGSYSLPMSTSEQIALLAKGTVELEQKVQTVEQEVSSIKNDMPLFGAESDELSSHVRRKGVDVLGGKNTEAYKDKSIRKKVYSDMYAQLKREFGLFDDDGRTKSYKALKRKELADAHEFIDCYTVPRCLEEEIKEANAQMNLELGA